MLHPDVNNEANQPDMPYQSENLGYHPQEEPASVPTPRFYQPAQEDSVYPQEPQYYQQAPQATPTRQFDQPSFPSPDNNQPYRPPTPPQRPSSGGLRSGAILLLALVLALVFGVGIFAGWQFGHGSGAATVSSLPTGSLQTGVRPQATIPPLSGNNIESVRQQVIANVRPAVVQINVTTSQGQALGSGVIVDRRGYIVTNNHVVGGAQKIDQVVLYDGTIARNATVVGTDPADDLAVIKITPPANMVVATIGNSSNLQVGADVLAIGNPLGNTQTVTSGIVSALNRNVSEGQSGQNNVTLPNAIQTDAPINPGNSGGALVDLQGQLVGIPTLTAIDPEFNAPANGVGFAIPSNRVQFIVLQIIQNGKVTHTGRAVLGIFAATVDPSVQTQDNLSIDHGVLITSFSANSAAQKAGLQVGDVIVQIDNTAIDSPSTLQDVLISKNPGDSASVHVYRGSQQLTVPVTLGELQAGS